MKKVYYILTLVAIGFSSCKPLSNTYNDIDSSPTPRTLTTGVTTSYLTIDAANAGIISILNTKYPDYGQEKSNAVISFPLASGFNMAADNVYSHVAYTLISTDYSLAANTTTSLTDQAVLNFLSVKYPNPVANQLAVLTYQYQFSGATPTAGVTVTDSFIYLANIVSWVKIYTVSPAQYASVNRGTNNYFLPSNSSTGFAGDLPVLPGYFNSFLQADPNISATAKTGDIVYVSYRYNSTTQNVLPLTFNGTNWTANFTLGYLRQNGIWIPDPNVYVTLPAVKNNPDYIWLSNNTTIGQATARTNVVSFGDFNTSTTASTTTWTDAEVTAALAAILGHKISSPVIGVPYKVTYSIFPGANPVLVVSKTYKYDGTNFVLQQ